MRKPEEHVILEWITGARSVAREARIVAAGRPANEEGSRFSSGVIDLKGWLRMVIYDPAFREWLPNSLHVSGDYASSLRSQMGEQSFDRADWPWIHAQVMNIPLAEGE